MPLITANFISKTSCGGELVPLLALPRTVFLNGVPVCVTGDQMVHAPETATITQSGINKGTVFVQGIKISVHGDLISDHSLGTHSGKSVVNGESIPGASRLVKAY